MEKETWRDIEGYEGLYQVSNFGNIKSLPRQGTDGGIMKPKENRGGYSSVNLTKSGKTKTYEIHRIVAQAFIPNFNNLPQVNHKDENKINNKVDNLEWMTSKENSSYGTRVQRIGKSLSKTVYQYDLNRNLVKVWSSTNECDRSGFDSGTISKCCNGKRKKHNGYIWSYSPL